MSTSNIIFKPYIGKNAYDGGITRGELNLQDSELEIWKLSSNENILGPSPLAMKAISENLNVLNEYSYRDDLPIREAIKESNSKLNLNRTFAANGGSEIIQIICRAFLSPDLECIISTPTFIAYKNYIKNEGAKVIDVPLNSDDYTIDVESILNAITSKTRLVFITNPNNPTGTYTSKKQIDYLINSLPDHVVAVYDEVYYHFSDAKDFPRAIDYIENGKNVIGIHSFSKSYGLAGIRLGYGFSTEEITSYIANFKRPFILNTLTMVAGIAALKDEIYLSTSTKLVRQERNWLYEQFKKLGIQFWESQTNFVYIEPIMNNKEFTTELLKSGVMVRPCDAFGAKNGVRITVGNRKANNALINAIKSIYKSKNYASIS